MTDEPWNKHTPGDPMPCKCGESVVEVKLRDNFTPSPVIAGFYDWGRKPEFTNYEITNWRFVERKGEDAIAADPYDSLEWDEDDTATVVLKVPGQPEWVRDDDLVRFGRAAMFASAGGMCASWGSYFAFQIKRRPALTPAEPQLLAVLAAATDDEAAAPKLAADTLRLLDEIERLNEALRFYADPEIYKPHPHGPAFERRDLSFVARAALAEGGPDDR